MQKAQRVPPLVEEDDYLLVRLSLRVQLLSLLRRDPSETPFELPELFLVVHPAQQEVTGQTHGEADVVNRRRHPVQRRHQADDQIDLARLIERLQLVEHSAVQRLTDVAPVPVAQALDLEAGIEDGADDG